MAETGLRQEDFALFRAVLDWLQDSSSLGWSPQNPLHHPGGLSGTPQAPLDCPGRGCNAKAHTGICFEGLTFWNELGLFVGSCVCLTTCRIGHGPASRTVRKTAPRRSGSYPGPQDFTRPRHESSFLEGGGVRVVNFVLKPSSMLNPNCPSPHWACLPWEPAGKFGASGGAGLLLDGR